MEHSRVPFFIAPGEPASTRRVLLLSYHFPPSRGAGALRWQKLSEILAEQGWGLDVVGSDPAEIDRPDWERMAELPAGTAIWGVRYPRVAAEEAAEIVGRVLGKIRSVTVPRVSRPGAVPDGAHGETESSQRSAAAEGSVAADQIRWDIHRRESLRRLYAAWLHSRRDLGWMRAVTETARDIFVAGRHEAVISCGPPHMVHEAGRRISASFGVPLLLDLRDPWSLPRRLPSAFASPLWFTLARQYERRAVRQASVVVANTDAVRDAMRNIYAGDAAKFVTVMNGFDEQRLPPPSPSGRFVIAYAGGIYLDRNPRLLFRAAAAVIAQLGLEPDHIGFEFVGSAESFGDVSLPQMAAEEGISEYVSVRGLRPRSEALRLLAGAQLLVSLPQDSPWSIPSKVFEYMCFHAWVLALAQVDSPVEMLLRDTDADVVDPRDVAGMTEVIRKRYQQHGKGVVPLPISRDARFSRRAQAQILIDALERSAGVRADVVRSAGASTERRPRALE